MIPNKARGSFAARAFLLGIAWAFAPHAAASPADDLKHADAVRTSDFAAFNAIVDRLAQDATLGAPERDHLRYLLGWRHGYRGEFEQAITDFRAVIDTSPDATLRFRASASIVNALTIGKHYVDAYTYLNRLHELLPQVADPAAREQGLVVAAIHYNQVGQYELALRNARQLIDEHATPGSSCKGTQLALEARYKRGSPLPDISEFATGVAMCESVGEPIYANLVRTYWVRLLLRQNNATAAVTLLRDSSAGVAATKYPRLISEFEALLAQSEWQLGNVDAATTAANAAIDHAVANAYTEPVVAAHLILSEAAARAGDYSEALASYRTFAAADKAYLDDVGAQQLAYQMVQTDAIAKKAQIESLSKANQVLTLSEELAVKSAENSRLTLVLLVTIVAFICLWGYRIKRSQLQYKKLAQRDGLTGIANRQHFIAESELAVAYCRKSGREVCVVLLDLDHFKTINDNHGHATGDLILKRVVAACASQLRSVDLFGRLGGEEFGIVMPDCELADAMQRADALRAAIAALRQPGSEITFPVSASFGVATTSTSGYELHQLIVDADEALYRAKNAGRDRVELFTRAA